MLCCDLLDLGCRIPSGILRQYVHLLLPPPLPIFCPLCSLFPGLNSEAAQLSKGRHSPGLFGSSSSPLSFLALLCRHLMMTQLVITELSLLHSYELLLTMSVCMAALKLSFSVECYLSLCYSDLIEQLQLKIQSQSINREF